MEDQKSFNYSISHKNKMLVVSFSGEEMSPVVVPALEAVRAEILAKEEVVQVVFYFQNIDRISNEALASFAQLQRDVRAKPADLRLCSLKESLREKLLRMGVVRGLEVAEDLKSALLSFPRAA
ncbi:STAS domain-containing protein [Bdellovibrio sp. ZAP7]|uniref:STAS domain-containing protein n=1 Tax=Bdellovibrio sp. ZAP7 TaxID=2231053 RepID=UPI001FED31E6|nr:STAS domain-containing protein [Bdellovibrio sp. ZAP7]